MTTATNSADSSARSPVADLDECRALFTTAREDVRELVSGLSEEDFNWRPTENEWSVGECLDHLCVIGGALIPLIDAGIEKARTNGWKSDGPYRYGPLGNWFVRVTGPTGTPPRRKFKAPKMYTPSSNHSITRLVDSFVPLQDKFIERIENAKGLDIGKVKVSSPALWLMRLSLGQWFALLAGHQLRHFQQAQSVRSLLDSRAS